MDRRPLRFARAALLATPAALFLQATACGGGDSRPVDATRAVERASCTFGTGALGDDTVGKEYPVGDDIPIDHFIILMLENRSFDHYFGTMQGVEGLPANVSNLDSMGNAIAPYHETTLCIDDVNHGWDGSHQQYADGANSGFVLSNEPDGRRAMGYYDERELPYYRSLYSTFAMSDHHHCSALGPTWVNRWYSLAATSFGRTSNTVIPREEFGAYAGQPYMIYELLERNAVSWSVFYTDAPFSLGGFGGFTFEYLNTNFYKIESFYTALSDGTLPSVSFVEPSYVAGVAQTDEHPPANPQHGQAFVAQVVDAVMNSPLWARTALIITYDEHGGYYDHVPPPSACVPDDKAPIRADGSPAPHAFDRLGFRVPLVIVSPYAKANYVSDHVTDHTSVLRLLEVRFGLPAFTRRDANAWPLLDMFDFENPPFATPPNLTAPTIDLAATAACRAIYPDPFP